MRCAAVCSAQRQCPAATKLCRPQFAQAHLSRTKDLEKLVAAKICGVSAAALLLLGSASAAPAAALASEKVADFATSGLIPVPGVFRDTVEVFELEDPEVDGVVIYITDYKKSLSSKISSSTLFSDSTQASLTCAAVGPVVVKNPQKIRGREGQEIFKEMKSLFNQANLVRRIYDESRGAVLDVGYSTRFTGGETTGRYKTSVCAVPVTPVAAVTATQ